MGRSQRHRVEEQGFSSAGAFYEQGAINDAVCKAIDGDIAGAIPVITSLDPAFVLVGGANVTLRVLGAKFSPSCVIYINGWDEETTYVGTGELTTAFTTSLFTVPATLPVLVKKANTLDSNVVYFEVRSAAGMQAVSASTEDKRTFPIGPLNLVRIDPSEDPVGVWYVVSLADGMQFREGDAVLIEATGYTPTNGNYMVMHLEESDTERRFFVRDTVIPASIEAKGRVTINAGA